MKFIHISILILVLSLLPQKMYSQQRSEKVRTYTFKDGSIYEGDLKWHRPNGIGSAKYVNGDTYNGAY
ncbi:MAG: hypothetical protein J6Q08_05105, partial [Bacteroidaceae bacterium]|nr:hypothetical protein [Bacteroidaceae bacterium]